MKKTKSPQKVDNETTETRPGSWRPATDPATRAAEERRSRITNDPLERIAKDDDLAKPE
jgi:hypothetical protein